MLRVITHNKPNDSNGLLTRIEMNDDVSVFFFMKLMCLGALWLGVLDGVRLPKELESMWKAT